MPGARIWTKRTQAASYADSFRACVYSPTLRRYLAVGDNEGIQTSLDAFTWAAQSSPMLSTADVLCAAWTEGAASPLVPVFIIGGLDFIYTSPDGITWTERTQGAALPYTMHDVDWDDVRKKAIAVGSISETGKMESTPDGVNWTSVSITANPLRCVALSSGSYVAAGGGGQIHESDDGGATWTTRTPDGGYSDTFNGAAWSPELALFALAGDTGEIQTSPDGITWTSRTTPSTEDMQSMTWSSVAGLFLATGNSATLWTSPDGITWTAQMQAAPFASPLGFTGSCAGKDLFLAVGGSGELQTAEALTIDPKHARHFKNLLPRGAVWGRR